MTVPLIPNIDNLPGKPQEDVTILDVLGTA